MFMEISKIITKPIIYNHDLLELSELIQILNKLKEKNVKSLFLNSTKEFKDIYNIMHNMHADCKNTYILNLELNYLINSMRKNDINSLLIFFILNDYVKKDLNNIIDDYLKLNNDEKLKIAKLSYSFINSIHFKTDGNYFIKNLDYFKYLTPCLIKIYDENELFEKAINMDTLSNKSILNRIFNKNTYSEFKYSLDKCQNHILDNLKWTLISLNFELYMNYINKLTNPLKIILFLNNLNTEDLIKIAENINFRNKWLLFELIHLFCLKNETNEEIFNCTKKLVRKLYEMYKSLFLLTKQYFYKNELFNKSYAILLSKLNNNNLKNIVSTIEFDDSAITIKTSLFLTLKENMEEFTFKNIIQLTYEHYEDSYNKRFLSNNYIKRLWLTDYQDFIKYHYCNNKEKDEILTELKKILDNINCIFSESFLSKSHMKHANYFYLTKLFFLSYGYCHNNLYDENVLNSAKKIFKNKIYCKRLLTDNDYNIITTIKNNMCKLQ